MKTMIDTNDLADALYKDKPNKSVGFLANNRWKIDLDTVAHVLFPSEEPVDVHARLAFKERARTGKPAEAPVLTADKKDLADKTLKYAIRVIGSLIEDLPLYRATTRGDAYFLIEELKRLQEVLSK